MSVRNGHHGSTSTLPECIIMTIFLFSGAFHSPQYFLLGFLSTINKIHYFELDQLTQKMQLIS